MTIRRSTFAFAAILLGLCFSNGADAASEFTTPWSNKARAIVLDGYEHNSFNLAEIVKDPRIAAFIHKGSDGLPANYHCKRITDAMQQELCMRIWRNYAVSRELYQTRRTLAKALGLKWGAYHLGRPGNPIEQANHFIDYAEPSDDELIAIDIEDNDPERFMSLQDAQIFAEHIKLRTGRYPVLYTNGTTAKYIADRRLEFPTLSRLQLWYARYESNIAPHFPKGNWQDYALWQFTSQSNCTKQRCPYRPAGTNRDIDVNVADMTVAQLKNAWPLGELVRALPPENLPMPGNRPYPQDDILMAAAEAPIVDYRALWGLAQTATTKHLITGISQFFAPTDADIDMTMTASVPQQRVIIPEKLQVRTVTQGLKQSIQWASWSPLAAPIRHCVASR
ncbi:GH25 family lysozyme [Phyllobacterium sp. SB3]|uniref:glycoside hydrolase family 25 protein n=1 Tax=Phyllobacterium sp. SB3 TaxID=3156073 RepID=UPI0032AE8666